MSKEIYISSTPHETRLAIVEKDELTEIYYERENEYTLAGSIYNGRVTRVLPGMQSSFVDIGLERDAFLYITDFMEEAGESADFEGASRSGGEKRESSGEKREGGGERRDRNDRGRGRRDERPRNAQAEATPIAVPVEDELLSADRAPEGEEIGEGAPGADGSRRWRGRRGRRRGRGGNREAEGETTSAAPESSEPFIEQDDEFEGQSFEAQASDEQPAESNSEQQAPREFKERNDRGGRDRGRDRRRGGRDNSRHDAIRGRFAPRGLRNDAEPVSTEPSAPEPEPFILPGESLSKYRKGEEQGSAAGSQSSNLPANVIIPKPSTEFVLADAWDGGAVLPGETIRRREPAAQSSNEPRSESSDSRGDFGRGRDRRRDRDQRRGPRNESSSSNEQPVAHEQTGLSEQPIAHEETHHEPSHEAPHEPHVQSFAPAATLSPAEAVLPGVTSGHDTDEEIHPVDVTLPEVSEDTEEEGREPVAEFQEAAEFQEIVTEYEPEDDASASFRVDPVSPREFRQSAPVEELTAETEHSVEHQAGSVVEAPHEEQVDVEEHAHESYTPEPQVEAVESNQPAQGFAPGEGVLEEELLDDEDDAFIPLHASADHDDMEEETLEHAADLGRMIRDMSIDEITGAQPVAHEDEHDEEDDFDIDEEDLEEDQFESTEEEGEEGDEFSGSDLSEVEEGEYAEAGATETTEGEQPAGDRAPREGGRRGRRDGRRGGRDRGERSSSSTSDRSGSDRSGGDRSSSGGRDRGRSSGRGGERRGRPSVQATDLPAISDLLKPGQEVLVQIAKEPIAKKGARITSHIALPGRFLVFMPTVSHVGVSRKIESDGERRRLKEILLSERGDASGGFIVRTAASGASEEELRSDLRFLLNLWADIKTRSESSKSPALIYHDLNLIERILRDQVTDNFSAIWVDTEAEYERVLRFLQRFQPSLIRRVKLYSKDTPLFEQFGINEEINKALRSKVWLKSGGSIVINQTEALVAIDINTGKFVGKTTKLEDTIVKTNLDAIPEIVRQIRLRDLGGIIIIDFIDMDERKNRNKVMAALEEELKSDRAPSKVLQFNDFGLVAITRKRVKQSLERTLSTTCGVCQGTGMVKSPVTVCNDIYIEMRKMHKHMDKGDVMLRVHPEVVKQLKSNGGKWLQEMEELSRKTILVKSDPSLHPEQFDIH
ncbi:Rne/Rng family ribonuclease [Granulicella paludicola]|uniref:Rne/Rng family ribonuclease n=1 Tax=Granulicella paludicola TaxID=474951 RepID=UPI0021E00665|nr:Rne/Rng family ribonuclease [Granulicella paludicola]